MRLRLFMDYAGYPAGIDVEIDDATGRQWIMAGLAERVDATELEYAIQPPYATAARGKARRKKRARR